MIENPTYQSPYYGLDKKGNYRTWPSFAGPEPEEQIPGWAEPVTAEPLPVLVEPGVRHDPMEAGEPGE